MKKLKILVTMRPHEPTLKALQADPGLDIQMVTEPYGGHGVGRTRWPVEWMRDTEIMFTSGVMPSTLEDANAMKFIQLGSAGYEEALPLNLPARSIRAANSLGIFDIAIAEWNICMIISLARDLRGMIRNQEYGIWDRHKRFQRELRDSVVGFWGYGGLARETARQAKALGLKIHVLARNGVKARPNNYLVPGTGDREGTLPDRVFSMEQKKEFLNGLDFLIVAMPATPVSIGSIGEEELHALPPHCCLLNPARGPLIKEEALLRALREGWIAAAALDTHYHYPMPADHPLWRFPNVIMTPHVSGSSDTQHFLPRSWDIFAQNIKRYRNGEPLLNELSTSALRGE